MRVNCAALPEGLIESELFGHEKGAFSGAVKQREGRFERASGGTIFLDEIGELAPDLQAALLGALERRSIRRLGGKSRVDVDVRVLAATNRDLRAEVNAATFRADLFYRLAVVQLMVPPLRDRREDIPRLVERFVRLAGHQGPVSEVIDDEAMAALQQHRWPGNVRELRNVVHAAVVMGELPEVAAEAAAVAREEGLSLPMDAIIDEAFTFARSSAIEKFEALYLEHLLRRAGGNVARAARYAKINRSYLNRLIRKHGLRAERD